MTYLQGSALPVEQRGSSSIEGTALLCSQLPALFERYNIRKLFDAGSNDCAWQRETLAKMVEYYAGEHNPIMVDLARENYPEINIIVHDMLRDPFPLVDCLFMRDVAIHLNNAEKRIMITNWLNSQTPWLLITQQLHCTENLDIVKHPDVFPFAHLNWQIDPWNFPEPTDQVLDMPNGGRHMFLWHRDQILGLV